MSDHIFQGKICEKELFLQNFSLHGCSCSCCSFCVTPVDVPYASSFAWKKVHRKTQLQERLYKQYVFFFARVLRNKVERWQVVYDTKYPRKFEHPWTECLIYLWCSNILYKFHAKHFFKKANDVSCLWRLLSENPVSSSKSYFKSQMNVFSS